MAALPMLTSPFFPADRIYVYKEVDALISYRGLRKQPKQKNLSLAAKLGDIADVIWYVDNGYSVNEPDSYSDTPLHNACASSSVNQNRVVELLLKHGADPYILTGTGQTAYHLLAVSTSPNRMLTFKVLFDAGVPVDLPDAIGRSALYYALATREDVSVDVVWLLIVNRARLFHVGSPQIRCFNRQRRLAFIRNSYLSTNDDSSDRPPPGVSVPEFVRCCDDDIPDYNDQCAQLIQSYQTQHIARSTTLFDFLRASDEALAALARDKPNTLLELRRRCNMFNARSVYCNEFRIQYTAFAYHFAKFHLPPKLTYDNVTLPYECVLIIASHLALDDLLNFSVAFTLDEVKPRLTIHFPVRKRTSKLTNRKN